MTGRRLEFDVSGLGLALEGLPGAISDVLAQRWSPFLRPAPRPLLLGVSVEIGGAAAPDEGALGSEIASRFEAGRAAFELEEGSIEVGPGGLSRAIVAPAPPDRQAWGLVNLLCAATGWALLGRRGGALHAAAAVLDGRAFLLVGPQGSGKTTWARLAGASGAQVLGDEVILVEARGGRLEALASPFRDELATRRGPGRFPVAAILAPRKAAAVRLEPLGRAAVEARLLANLLYAARAFGSDPSVAAAVGSIASSAPAFSFGFPPEGDFLDRLRRL